MLLETLPRAYLRPLLIAGLLTVLGDLIPFSNVLAQSERQSQASTAQFLKSLRKLPIPQKKQAFFDFLYPHTIKANLKVLQQRQWVQLIGNPDLRYLPVKIQWQHLLQQYRVQDGHLPKTMKQFAKQKQQLLKRIDIIPPSLILAQAANESAWGQSRFALLANNLFGQWCYTPGCGLTPSRRGKNAKHEVKKFPTIDASIESYLLNLNRNAPFSLLRTLRSTCRKQGFFPSGNILAKGLIAYSQRREQYVHSLQQIIQHGHLEQYDEAFRQKWIPQLKPSYLCTKIMTEHSFTLQIP